MGKPGKNSWKHHAIFPQQCLTFSPATSVNAAVFKYFKTKLPYCFSYVKKLIENQTEAEETVQLLKVS